MFVSYHILKYCNFFKVVRESSLVQSLPITFRRIAAGPFLSCPRWPCFSAFMRCPGIFFTDYKFGLLCRATPPDLVRAATPFFPKLFPHLPCDCTGMGAGASHGKVTIQGLSLRAGFVYFEIGTPKNSPDVCRRLTLSRNSANFHASLLDAPSRKQAFSPAPPDRLGLFLPFLPFPKAPELLPGQ